MAGKKKPPYASLEEAGANYEPPSYGEMLAASGNPYFAAVMAERAKQAEVAPADTQQIASTLIDALNLPAGALGAAVMGRPALSPGGVDTSTPTGPAAQALLQGMNAAPLALGAAMMGRPALTPKSAPFDQGPPSSMAPIAEYGPPMPQGSPAAPPAHPLSPLAAPPPEAPASAQGGGGGGPFAPFAGAPPQGIQPPAFNDPEVQAMLQRDPQARAMYAPSISQIEYTAPDFLARPDGEAMLEEYAFRQMIVMGDHAPKALQQQWQDIQQAKRTRLGARANYFADLIKQRHIADLQGRNQSMAQQEGSINAALDRVANIRVQEAVLQNQQAIQAARAIGKAGPKPLKAQDVKFLDEMTRKMSGAQTIRKELGSLMTAYRDLGWLAGRGRLSRMGVAVGDFFGTDASTTYTTKVNKYHNELIRQLAEVAGTRAVDANKEADRVRNSFPGEGAEEGDWIEYIQIASDAARKLMMWQAEYADAISPGIGARLRADFADLTDAEIVHEEMNARDSRQRQAEIDARVRREARSLR